MIFPFKGEYRVTRKFGIKDPAYSRYPDSRHSGVDWAVPANIPLLAVSDGIVEVRNRDANLKTGRGKEVSLLTSKADFNYCHMNRIDVVGGQFVKKGQQLGLSGFTGYVMDANGQIGTPGGAHLHFEVVINGSYVDPDKYLKEVDVFTDQQINELISLAYNGIAGRSAAEPGEAAFQRDNLKKGGVQALINMMRGFFDNNDVAWKKNIVNDGDLEDAQKWRELKKLLEVK